MTSITLLPCDILSSIFGLLSLSTDLIAFKEVSKSFGQASNTMKIKIAYMNDKTQTTMSQLRFTNRRPWPVALIGHTASSDKIQKFKRMSCANAQCSYIAPFDNLPSSHLQLNMDFVEGICGVNYTRSCKVMSLSQSWARLRAVGLTTFYWPKELMEPHDEVNDPYGTNFEAPIRMRQCEEGPSVTRVVPYCLWCMNKHMNFGTRNDGLEVPQANMNGYINV